MQWQFLPILVSPQFVRMAYKDVGQQLCVLRKEWQAPFMLGANSKVQVVDISIAAMLLVCSEGEGKVACEE
jgi:hypothetical protein